MATIRHGLLSLKNIHVLEWPGRSTKSCYRHYVGLQKGKLYA